MNSLDKDLLEQLVLAYRDGNQTPEVMEKMYEIMFPELKKRAQSLAANNRLTVHDSESLIQEGFLRGITNINKVEKPREFTAYVKESMWNIMVDDAKEYSKRANKDILEDYDSDEELAGEDFIETVEEDYGEFIPGENIDLEETKAIVEAAVKALPEKQSKVVWRYFFEGMSQKDIAKELNVADSTVRTTLNQAKKNLYNAISDYEKEHDIRLHGIFAMPFMSSLLKEMAMPYAIGEAAKEGIKANILGQLGLAEAIVGATEAGSTASTIGTAVGSVAAGGVGASAAKAGIGAILKTTMAKVAAGVVAVSLVGGGVYYSATHPMFGAAPNEEQQYYETINEEEVDEIVLGEDIADELVVGEEGVWVKFTPEETGFYVFKTKMSSEFQKKGIQITSFRGEIDERKIMHTPGIIIGEDQKHKGTYIIQTSDDGTLYAGSTYYIRIQYKVDHGISSMYLDTATRKEVPQAPQLEKKSNAIPVMEGDDLAEQLKKGETWFVFTPEETAMYRFEIGNGKSWNADDVEMICTYKTNTTEFDRVGSGIEAFQDFDKNIHCLYFATDADNTLEAGKKYYIQFDLKKDGVFQNLKLTRTEESHDEEQLENKRAAVTVDEGDNFASHLKKGECWIAFTPSKSGIYRIEIPGSNKYEGNKVDLITYKEATSRYDEVGLGINSITDFDKDICCLYFAEEVENYFEGGITYYLQFKLKADGVFENIAIKSTNETFKDVESKLE